MSSHILIFVVQETYEKETITIPIVFKNEIEKKKMLGKFGNDFSQINAKWNSSMSDTVFRRIQSDPSEWAFYHTQYRKNRKKWATNPLKEVIKQMKNLLFILLKEIIIQEIL